MQNIVFGYFTVIKHKFYELDVKTRNSKRFAEHLQHPNLLIAI
jgi:hypothetical protein